jgi:hypothetical protein
VLSVGWPQALGWRLARQLLDPIGDEPVEGVVGRLGAVQAQNDAAMELAIRVRRVSSGPGEIDRALADGRLIKTFAFRGATHVMTPEAAGVYLALRASSRMWELPSWRSYYRLEPSDWPDFRAAVREALADGPLTRTELGAAVTSTPRFRHLGFAFGEGGSGTLLKPLAWLGEISFGPPRAGRSTFQWLGRNPRWSGILEIDEAGPRAVEAYVRTYGPTTPHHLRYWLGEGLGAGGKRIAAWIAALGDRVVPIDVDGEACLALRDDLDELGAATSRPALRLLPAYDQWVLGPGTADQHVVPQAHRALVSRGAAVAVVGGVVVGTWSVRRGRIEVDWFAASDRPPDPEFRTEAARVEGLLATAGGS